MKRTGAVAGALLIILTGLDSRPPQAEIRWEKRTPMPGALYAFNAVTIGNKIFAVGGRGDRENFNRFNYQFDLDSQEWTVKGESLFDRSNHAVAAFGDKIYVFGGNENPSKTEVYDPRTDSWKELAEMPTPRQHINYSAAAVNGKIYVIGGNEKRGERNYTITGKNEEYDPATDTWSEKASLPVPRQLPAVVSFKNSIYVISGTDDKYDDQSTVFLYHPDTDTWETRAPMPEARFINGAAVVKDKIVVVTGKRRDQSVSKAFVYDPDANRWHFLGQLPLDFMLAGVTSAGGRLYVLGGSTHELVLSTFWEAELTFPGRFSDESTSFQGPNPGNEPSGMTPDGPGAKNSLRETRDDASGIPSRFDWREENIMSPVKHQMNLGSCGVFAGVAVFEALIKKETGITVDLSEQQIINSSPDWVPSGISSVNAMKYMKEHGLVLEERLPYQDRQTAKMPDGPPDFILTDYRSVVTRELALSEKIRTIKEAVCQHGPIATNMVFFKDLDRYKEGIYIYDGKSKEQGGHWVVIVGWRDDPGVKNGGYWICRNSWGDRWGERGYFNIAYGECGIDDFWFAYGLFKQN